MEVRIDKEQILIDRVKAKVERVINKGTFVEKSDKVKDKNNFLVYFSINKKDIEKLKKHFPKMKVSKMLFNISKIDLNYSNQEEGIDSIIILNESKEKIMQERNNRDKESKTDRFGMRF